MFQRLILIWTINFSPLPHECRFQKKEENFERVLNHLIGPFYEVGF